MYCKYCEHCGTRFEDNTRFCTFCGAKRQQSMVTPQDHNTSLNQSPQSNAAPVSISDPTTRKKRSIIAILVAILVIFAGLQFMSLSIVGETSTASVTSVRQDRKSYGETSPNPNRYRIKYTFSVRGKSYAGSSSMIFKKGLREDQKINIRYLPYYPRINSPADKTNIMSGLLLTGFGTFMLILGIQGKAKIGLRVWKRTKERSVLSDDKEELKHEL